MNDLASVCTAYYSHNAWLPTYDRRLFLEATLFAVCCSTEDKNEGTRAFLEKRPAQFKRK